MKNPVFPALHDKTKGNKDRVFHSIKGDKTNYLLEAKRLDARRFRLKNFGQVSRLWNFGF
jgi:hypothetical protein